MSTPKEDALKVISKMSEGAHIEDVMYRLYVLGKIRKGQDAIKDGKVISLNELKKEMASW